MCSLRLHCILYCQPCVLLRLDYILYCQPCVLLRLDYILYCLPCVFYGSITSCTVHHVYFMAPLHLVLSTTCFVKTRFHLVLSTMCFVKTRLHLVLSTMCILWLHYILYCPPYVFYGSITSCTVHHVYFMAPLHLVLSTMCFVKTRLHLVLSTMCILWLHYILYCLPCVFYGSITSYILAR